MHFRFFFSPRLGFLREASSSEWMNEWIYTHIEKPAIIWFRMMLNVNRLLSVCLYVEINIGRLFLESDGSSEWKNVTLWNYRKKNYTGCVIKNMYVVFFALILTYFIKYVQRERAKICHCDFHSCPNVLNLLICTKKSFSIPPFVRERTKHTKTLLFHVFHIFTLECFSQKKIK